MRAATLYNHMERLRGRIRSLYYCATGGYTHQQIIDRRNEIFKEAKEKKLPQNSISCLYELDRELWRQLQNSLVWAHIGSDGRLYESYGDLSEEDKIKCQNQELGSYHFYVETPIFRTPFTYETDPRTGIESVYLIKKFKVGKIFVPVAKTIEESNGK
jgi:hypothetical protein